MADPRTPPPENRPPEREREVIVTDGGGRSGMSGVVVAVLAIVIIAIVGFLVLNMIGGDGGEGTGDVNVEAPEVDVPDDVNVDVNEGGGDGGS